LRPPLAGSFPCYKTKGFLRLRPEGAACDAGSLPAPPTHPARRDRLPFVAGSDFAVLSVTVLFVVFVLISCPQWISVFARSVAARGGLASRFAIAALCECGACGWLTDSRMRAAA
jgi:hypothetical protein